MAIAEQKAKSKPAHPQHEEGCPVRMYGGRCGRPIYDAPAGTDKEPVCLMHSRDPKKDDTAFQVEFERILQVADDGVADFTRFVFPTSNYSGREFKPECIFIWATFTQAANFREATFTQAADFREATFTQAAKFIVATFAQDADFGRATFAQAADFRWATFTQEAVFSRATFTQHACFGGATFTQHAYFYGATFTQEADFSGATFTRAAKFFKATFTQAAYFSEATFTQAAYFSEATFTQEADFRDAKFLERVEFSESVFRSDGRLEPGPIFSLAQFQKPNEVTFYKTDLGQALFHNCDVSEFHFSDVTWRKREGSGKSMVFDEEVQLETRDDYNEALQPKGDDPNKRNYPLIAELYQQLKKNYDDRRDYWTAGDFHYGEMEMKRLASPRRNGFLRWWHRNVGLVAWYKYASEYGESYVRPVVWLGIVLALFTLAYPIAGLRLSEAARKSSAVVGAIHESPLRDPGTAQPTSTPGVGAVREPPRRQPCTAQSTSTPGVRAVREPPRRETGTATVSEVSYRRFFPFANDHPQGPARGALAFFGHSLVTALDVAFFQKTPEYESSTTLGHVLTLVELLLTSTLIALFLLAVRRQFRR